MEQKPTGQNYFRIKTEYTKEQENGTLQKTKIEELVLATSYTEAEKVAYKLAELYNRTQFSSISIEIVKDKKINDILFNDILAQDDDQICGMIGNFFEEGESSGTGLYSVAVDFYTLDEKTAKEKKTRETLYTPATSNADATKRIIDHLGKSLADFVIRDTKFDKAEAIYWPTDVHRSKTQEYDQQ